MWKVKAKKDYMLLLWQKGPHSARMQKIEKRTKEREWQQKLAQKDSATSVVTEGTNIVIVIDEKFIGFTGHYPNWVIDSEALYHATARQVFHTW